MSRFSPVRGALRLTVHAVENLRVAQGFPYVRVSIASQQHHTNPAAPGPINASFGFTVGSDRSEEQYVRVEVRDDGMKGNQEIGHAVVPLSEVVGWRGAHRVDIVAHNGVELCGTVVLSADFTADGSAANQPSMYPAVSAQPAYNPAFFGGSPSSAEPPPPYQVVDPYAPQQQPPQQYSSNAPYSPQSYPPPQYSPQPSQPSPARAMPAVPAVPAAFYPPSSNSPTWASPEPPPPPPTQTIMLPAFGMDVKDPRHQHPLRHMPTLYNGAGYACNLCRRENNGNGFHCGICNFDMCPQCFVRQPVVAAPAAGARDVRHQHPLYWQRLTGPGYRNGFRCDGCGNAGRAESWHCQQCNFDLHSQCLRQM